MIDKCILVTGGFDPIHSGHIAYINDAKKICEYLVVGINSDEWLVRKKGTNFYNWSERESIISEFKLVDKVINFDDSDNTASMAIMKCLSFSKKVLFANGGDRKIDNIPELNVFKNNDRVEFIYNVGGNNKINSSSSILKKYNENSSYAADLENSKSNMKNKVGSFFNKPWGKYRILSSGKNYKVKDIFINPNEKLSLQFHHKRSEHWIVVEGNGEVQLDDKVFECKTGDHIYIEIGQKHRISNIGNQKLILTEVAIGNYIEEDDIVRLKDIYGRK
jgi:cytidyltransferase-like protein